jgi:hypothetical protein
VASLQQLEVVMHPLTLELWLGVVGLALGVVGIVLNWRADRALGELRKQVERVRRAMRNPRKPGPT